MINLFTEKSQTNDYKMCILLFLRYEQEHIVVFSGSRQFVIVNRCVCLRNVSVNYNFSSWIGPEQIMLHFHKINGQGYGVYGRLVVSPCSQVSSIDKAVKHHNPNPLMTITKTFKELERFLTNMLLVALPTIACIDKQVII